MDVPFINGVCFDDLYTLDSHLSARLIYDGMVYVSEFKHDKASYGGLIIARDMPHAEDVAHDRGLGERILGTLEALKNCNERGQVLSILPKGH